MNHAENWVNYLFAEIPSDNLDAINRDFIKWISKSVILQAVKDIYLYNPNDASTVPDRYFLTAGLYLFSHLFFLDCKVIGKHYLKLSNEVKFEIIKKLNILKIREKLV